MDDREPTAGSAAVLPLVGRIGSSAATEAFAVSFGDAGLLLLFDFDPSVTGVAAPDPALEPRPDISINDQRRRYSAVDAMLQMQSMLV